MRSTFDFTPLLRQSVGFENLNRLFDLATRATEGDVAFPPYNIEKLSDDRYRITMAVAGFAENELEIMVHENMLVITGRSQEETNGRQYLHRGIAKRAFERRFQLADVIRVEGARFENGMLDIELVREVPEHKKPRKIAIGRTGAENAAIEGEKTGQSGGDESQAEKAA